MGKGVIDETLPQYIGTAALTSGDYLHEIIDKADLLLAVGHDLVEKPTNLAKKGLETIHINFFPAEIDDVTYNPHLEVIGDIGNTFWQLYESELDANNWDFSSIYTQAKQNQQKIQQHTEQELHDQEVLGPRQLAKQLREHLSPQDILALDNGLYKVWIARNYPAQHPNTVLLDNALATM